MTLFSVGEIIDILVMTLAIGFIFKNFFKKQLTDLRLIKINDLFFSALITAPGIILHELGHKFLAISLGFNATFNASYYWLFIAIVLSLLSFPFIIFVPAYVRISCGELFCNISPVNNIIISFACPGVNLLIFFICYIILKTNISVKTRIVLQFTKQINLFLFIFNMLPIPGSDGWHLYSAIFSLF